MKTSLHLASLFVLALAPTRSWSSSSDVPVAYRLGDEAAMQAGCMGPCACAVLIQSPLSGTLTLADDGFDGVFHHYQVLDVDWQFKSGPTIVHATGSGTYRVAGDQQQLIADLTVDGRPTQRYDSGLTGGGSAFPQLRVPIALHGFFCFDSVYGVQATPAVAGVRPIASTAFALRLGPNPFRGSAEIVFQLPKDGPVDLRIHDLAGREVKMLTSARYGAGPHALTWDGRNAAGARVPSGVYFVRLRSSERESRATLVKVD